MNMSRVGISNYQNTIVVFTHSSECEGISHTVWVNGSFIDSVSPIVLARYCHAVHRTITNGKGALSPFNITAEFYITGVAYTDGVYTATGYNMC